MRMFITLVFTVFVLSMVSNINSAPVFECLPNDVVEVTVNKTENAELVNLKVTVEDTMDCDPATAVTLVDDPNDSNLQKVNVTCFNYTVGVFFVVLITADPTVSASAMDEHRFNLTCEIPVNVTQQNEITLNGQPTTASLEGEYVVELTHSVDKTVAAVSENIVFTAELGTLTALEVRLVLVSMTYRISGTNEEAPLVADRCPTNLYNGVTLTISGSPSDGAPTKIDTTLSAFLLNVGNGRTAAFVEILFVYSFCAVENTTYCYVENGCNSGTSDQIGRKRRQIEEDENVVTRDVKERLIIFPSEVDKKNYVDRALKEAGLSSNPEVNESKPGEICVNKTVSWVMIALQVIVMVVCNVSSGVIFMKLKKNRKENIMKEGHIYNNKAH